MRPLKDFVGLLGYVVYSTILFPAGVGVILFAFYVIGRGIYDVAFHP